jgi:glycosyltransferase involved in cell wall biosynthesis
VRFNILTYNNGVGIVTDAILLKDLIYKNISTNVEVKFVGEQELETADVGVWIQNYNTNLLNNFKKNIFFINEEWSGIYELSNLHLFDYVICKSKYVKELLSSHHDVIHLPFISTDYYDSSILRNHSILHFAGRSIQKNTELALSTSNNLTLIDPYNRYKVNNNINHINTYQSSNQISQLLNSHNIHICCSLYESWGHYLYEGLSTGSEIICSDIPVFREQLDPDLVHFIPTTESIDLNYQYDLDNVNKTFPMRKSFHVDREIYINIIKDFKPKGSNKTRRFLFKQIIDKNSKSLIDFFKNI